jgi:hypothetical protein
MPTAKRRSRKLRSGRGRTSVRTRPLDEALLQPVDDHARRLVEAVARGRHLDAEVLVLDARETASEPEHRAPAGEVIEEGHLLDHAQRIVPRNDHRAGRELQLRRLAGEPREELHVVGTGRVVGEVVLGRPHRVVAERLGLQRQVHLVAHHLGVAAPPLVVLEDQEQSDVHFDRLRSASPRCARQPLAVLLSALHSRQ